MVDESTGSVGSWFSNSVSRSVKKSSAVNEERVELVVDVVELVKVDVSIVVDIVKPSFNLSRLFGHSNEQA